MALAKHAPSVVWAWKTDQGNWHSYPAKLSEDLENAWKTKSVRFPVDAERFVDTVKMVQRRFDMTGKAREVKREPQLALQNHVFAVCGVPKDLIATISKHGGLCTEYVTEKVTFVLCDHPASHVNQMAQAKSLKIEVVTTAAIKSLIVDRENADLKPHLVDLKNVQVTGDCTGVLSSAQSSSLSTNKGPAAENRVGGPVVVPKPFGLPWKNGYARPLDVSTEWLGALHLAGDANVAAILLEVTFFHASGEWRGILSMPSNGSKTQISGILVPGGGPLQEDGDASHTIFLQTQSTLMSGTDNRILNLLLRGNLDACQKTMKFSFLTLSYVRHVPLRPLAFLHPGTTWKGRGTTITNHGELEITESNSANFKGTIMWGYGSQSEVEGDIKANGEIHFTEQPLDARRDGELNPPVNYVCKVVPQLTFDPSTARIEGVWDTTDEYLGELKGIAQFTAATESSAASKENGSGTSQSLGEARSTCSVS